MYHSILILTGLVARAASGVDAQTSQDIAKFPYIHYSFSCVDKAIGYYADPSFGCQIFHMCDAFGRRIPHICPPLTLFNQRFRVCDWAYNVDCDEAVDHYYLNDLTYAPQPVGKEEDEHVRNDDDDPLTTSRGSLLSTRKKRKISRLRRRRLFIEDRLQVKPAPQDSFEDRSVEDTRTDDRQQSNENETSDYDNETKEEIVDEEKKAPPASTELPMLKEEYVEHLKSENKHNTQIV